METPTGSLTMQNLVNPKEKTYYYIILAVAIFIWLMVAISIIGIFIVGLLALVAWFTHGLLLARLRSESVCITPNQYPELHATFTGVCQRLGLAEVPELYLLQSGGILNAFATRHAGRNFVVIHSSFVETIGASSPMMKFLMGHEIGHIQRKHLFKTMYLTPGTILPLVGEAYHRACEATCDRYGAYAADDPASSMLALTVLASGREASNIDTRKFAEQHFTTRGFFVSWHELLVSYPTLSQRVANILGFQEPQFARRSARHWAAYPCALLFSTKNILLVYVAVVGISVLIALGEQVKPIPGADQPQGQTTSPPAPPSPGQ
jgi:Zn-dependent protease with chaperone function